VLAAIAYASADNMRLFQDCVRRSTPIEFYARYDGSCAVDPKILRWFLDQKSPSAVCRLVPKWLHAKVIWWEGEGVYIGSANLTDRAWNRNFEAGLFLSDGEIKHLGVDDDLAAFFYQIREHSRELTEEMYVEQSRLFDRRNKALREVEILEQAFNESDAWVNHASNPIQISSANSETQRYNRFKTEWNATLTYMRDIAKRASIEEYRPPWIANTVPPGVQADQFLHAYYYKKVRDGNRYPFEEAYERNRKHPESALAEQLAWWKLSEFDYSHEQTTIYEWAPIIRDLFSPSRILRLSEKEWVAAASCVHAIRDHAQKIENELLGLPVTQQNHEIKVEAFCHWLWKERSASGHSCLDTINYVVWGPGDITKRLWAAAHDPEWKLRHVAISTLGEIVGWANPEKYPPRNMRTSKSLRALGYDVAVNL
jgi:hypothetical protein